MIKTLIKKLEHEAHEVEIFNEVQNNVQADMIHV